MNIIQQLKKNEKPFGLMSEEMQKKAKAIGPVDFLILSIVGIAINWPKWNPFCGGDFVYKETYRLRADYEDEPEIVECEICLKIPGDYLYYVRRGVDERRLHKAYDDPDFAGSRFKPVYGDEIYTELWLNLDVELNGNYQMTHASHVLFRQKAKE